MSLLGHDPAVSQQKPQFQLLKLQCLLLGGKSIYIIYYNWVNAQTPNNCNMPLEISQLRNLHLGCPHSCLASAWRKSTRAVSTPFHGENAIGAPWDRGPFRINPIPIGSTYICLHLPQKINQMLVNIPVPWILLHHILYHDGVFFIWYIIPLFQGLLGRWKNS